MMKNLEAQSIPGWTVGESIAMELDLALTGVNGYFFDEWTEGFDSLLRSLPEDWLTEMRSLLGGFKRFVSILDFASVVAGTKFEADYSKATLAMREMTIQQALERMTEKAAVYGLAADSKMQGVERLVDLSLRFYQAIYGEIGIQLSSGSTQMPYLEQGVRESIQILEGGSLHTRFWHWLDRFYYEFYRPWRDTRRQFMDELEKKAVTLLGAREKTGSPPDVSWLTEKNPLTNNTRLNAAVKNGLLHVYFWVEPFGMPDVWDLLPGRVVVSYADPDAILGRFSSFVEDVADRTKALADPTRLSILRMIRHLGMVNTEIAIYMGLARPTVSVHAKILREAGLIRSYSDGRVMRHEVVPKEVRRLFHDLEKLLDLPPEGENDL